MKKVTIFLGLIGLSVAGLVLVLLWYLTDYQSGHASLGGVMGQMMGGSGTSEMGLAMPQGVWFALVGLIILVVAGAVGFVYFLAYPEIKTGETPRANVGPEVPLGQPEMSWAVLMRTSNADEKKVLSVLAAHDGTYLQKFVVKEAGLSKLKTHRIVSRLAERGIVSVERSGNTNQVSLSPWVRSETAKPASGVSSTP